MRRLYLISLSIALAACGSDSTTAPAPAASSFAGTWNGLLGGGYPMKVVATQSGTVISGTADLDRFTDTVHFTIYGLASPSAISLGFDGIVSNAPYHGDVNGVFVTSDSVQGAFEAGGDAASIEFKRQ